MSIDPITKQDFAIASSQKVSHTITKPLGAKSPATMLRQHDVQIRVRYQETDGQGRLHHANYFTYFEQGRTELLRAAGMSYLQVEEAGYLLVVVEIGCEYFLPAGFDDLLTVRTTAVRAKGARIEHRYEVFRDKELLARGHSVVACVDRAGKPKRIPDWLIPDSAHADAASKKK